MEIREERTSTRRSDQGAQQVFSQALSFWLALDAWGRGYVGEAIGAVLRLAFRDFACNRVYAYRMVRNPASGRVLASHGFRVEGVLRERVRKRRVCEDAILQALLRGDWLEADDSGR
jgi:[ribosomal protein S5]-alanine N-acetyltransferase